MKSAMKAVQSRSYQIKSKHNTARRNCLLDDETMDIMQDFSLGEGMPWKQITSSQDAKKMGKASTGQLRVREEELDRILKCVNLDSDSSNTTDCAKTDRRDRGVDHKSVERVTDEETIGCQFYIGVTFWRILTSLKWIMKKI